MAGVAPSDIATLKRIDPRNDGDWTVVQPSWAGFPALRFVVDPPFQSFKYEFLVFRDPNKGNLWQLSPIYPNSDNEYGHGPHMVTTLVNGIRIPVICGPHGEPHHTLDSVLGAAVKWTTYTSARMSGRNPRFSL